ncbi:glycoside hydrolase family 3 C-terminal domain-containing protein [Arthrobacter sp. zg-Y820]|uniref:glycoside hydrolase family 3 C-terminal domain-containing protein n=1 Tax=unclassified Arthrobacter TaxID=235627 RepID=UPI001E3974CC|nr:MULTISPECIES: glycoside hydrolase family 3 C-terminal domain-containing protein [unclassified Arthrobacter]MCC9196557.1 glycoside hydrolase family 3 C-terminal domain-containing protein [Arthrobacter sp. zg-Y820]MDK1279419.1 glycoside hydrolase family 3 C-terminal domain-containing protein [Arthrobacter sp. zg.Y820]WIB08200.1 glycoside hydrolase family 3 C-terminal domain-containing protein [Arthrobacter sp. zg-Y820]
METPAMPDLTLKEKIGLLSGAGFWETAALPGHGIRSLVLSDGPHGIRRPAGTADGLEPGDSHPATCFPAECATACSWDRSLLAELGTAVAREARAQGVDVLLGPGLNIKRTPLCGRNFEYFSEDPLLAGELGAAWTAAVQAAGVGASPKHFAANNQEADRMRVDAVVDQRTLHEIYLRAFEIVVRTAGPWTVMAAYNKVNGLHAAENPWLLGTVLRDTWGYEGAVISDWGAVTDRAAALAAGLDLEMPASGGLGAQELSTGLDAGTVTEQQVDTAVERILALVRRASVQPGPAQHDSGQPDSGQPGSAAADYAAHHELARRAAAASMVLLQNDGGILPLSPGGSLAVIGELARTPRYQGSGSSRVHPVHLVTPLAALADQVPDLLFEPGYVLSADSPCAEEDLADMAAAAAAAADTAVVFLGLPETAESEGFDRTTLELPGPQLELLDAVVTANPRTIVVLSNGGAVTTEWAAAVPAVLEAWLPGEAGGSAVADVLLGRAEPGGRLAETIPHRLADTAAYGNYPGEDGAVRYGEGLLVGYRWYDTRGFAVAFPFGHGLSYTTFEYSELEVSTVGAGASQLVHADLTLTNAGSRSGSEVVQLYAGAPDDDGRQRPLRELRGFEKVQLEPGESRRVSFRLDVRTLSRWDPGTGTWVADAGEYRLEVGASSRDIRLSGAAALDGTVPVSELTTGSPIAEWLADPDAAAVLVDALSAPASASVSDSAPESGAAGLPASLALVGSMPLNRLARFPGSPITPALLQRLEAELRARRGG